MNWGKGVDWVDGSSAPNHRAAGQVVEGELVE